VEADESPASALVQDEVASPMEAPVGPSLEEETAFLATERGNTPVPVTISAVIETEDERGELPPMEDLVTRIPGATRELIENLFRARFVTVKRIPKSALKIQ
jgi:hypothetical protein